MQMVIKKIIALASGLCMLGATLTGAMAADLGDYPHNFITKNAFDGSIVVGDKAAAEDVIGAIDIATSLQFTTTSEVEGETGLGTEGEMYKIERSTNKLNLGENIIDVGTVIDSEDLPSVLADGVFRNDDGKDYEYEQTIELSSAVFTVFSDNDYNDDEPTIGLHYDDGGDVLTYSLSFTSGAESRINDGVLKDFEDTQLTIMGKSYDIVEATNQSGGYLELMGGALLDTLEEGDIKIYTLAGEEYEVDALIISDTANSVKLKINGEITDAMGEDDTWKTSDGTEIGIRSIMPNEAGEVTGGDIVEFYIGAEKLVFENGETLELADEEIEDIQVSVEGTTEGDDYTLNKITLLWQTEDELFITEEDSAIMPGLDAIKIEYMGLATEGEEIIKVENDGDNIITITAPIKGKESYELPILYDDESGVGFSRAGDEDYELVLTTAPAPTTITYDDNNNNYIVISNSDSHETALLKVTGFDDVDGVDFEEDVSGKRYEKKAVNETFEVLDMTFTVDDFDDYTETVIISVDDSDFEGNIWYTPEGLKITLPTTFPSLTTDILFEEEIDDGGVDGKQFTVTVKSDMLNDVEAQVSGTNLMFGKEMGDSNEYLYYELTGEVNTKAVMDEGPDQPTLTIYYPGGETYGNLYVAETGATFGEITKTVTTETMIEQIEVGVAKLASEIRDIGAQNMILVGGPCANSVAADVMNVSQSIPACLEGFEEGKAIIKLYGVGDGNIALLVAGATAMDTRRAAKVMANYGDYDLSGDEIEVVGMTLNDIQISKIE